MYMSLAALGNHYPFVSYKTFIEFCKVTCIIEDATAKINEDIKKASNYNTSYSGDAQKTNKFKPAHASLTESQAGMCFANAIYEREQMVRDD